MNNQIEGLHEIHITTDPKDLFGLRMFCMEQKLKPILAVAGYGDFPVQPMFSKFKNGTSLEVIERAKEMERIMTDSYGIRVVRVKVEAMMHNKGVPVDPVSQCPEGSYFEFHLKIPVTDLQEWNRLADICKEKNAHISFNAFKKETIPLVTLRLPGHIGSKKAIELKDELMEWLKSNGFHSNSGIQCEYSVYDTNMGLDKGWLPKV